MRYPFTKIIYVGALLLAVSAPAQNLFEADTGTGNINEFTPGGAQSTFANLPAPPGPLAFNSAGNLFVGTEGVGVTEITPGGAQSTFASLGVSPLGLAFNSAGDLFVTTLLTSAIYEVIPNGTVNIFVTGMWMHGPLAFDGEGNLFAGSNGNIYEFMNNGGNLNPTPVFVANMPSVVEAMACDNTGDLFESSGNSIYEFINNGGILSSTPTVFASGLYSPWGLAFAPVPEPSSLALLTAGSAAFLIRRRKN